MRTTQPTNCPATRTRTALTNAGSRDNSDRFIINLPTPSDNLNAAQLHSHLVAQRARDPLQAKNPRSMPRIHPGTFTSPTAQQRSKNGVDNTAHCIQRATTAIQHAYKGHVPSQHCPQSGHLFITFSACHVTISQVNQSVIQLQLTPVSHTTTTNDLTADMSHNNTLIP